MNPDPPANDVDLSGWEPVTFHPSQCPLPRVPIRLRRYREEDREAVLAIYDANAPDRFPQGHRPTFEKFLEVAAHLHLTAPFEFLVVEEADSGEVIACGGASADREQPVNQLSYGLVAPDFQGHGIGATLLFARLVAVTTRPEMNFSYIFSVPKSIGYFLRFGFELYDEWTGEDGKRNPVAVLPYTLQSLASMVELLGERGHLLDL